MRAANPFVRMATLFIISAQLMAGAVTATAHAAAPMGGATPDIATIQAARLAEPLIRTAPTSPDEDAALATSLARYGHRADPTDFSELAGFVSQYPHSGWAASVWTNLGLAYLHDGYFSRAIAAWKMAWAEGRNATDPHAKATVDRAVGELAALYASLGEFEELSALFDDLHGRPITGSPTEMVQTARETLSLVNRDPRHLFNCGPVGLKLLIRALNPDNSKGDFLLHYRVGPKGSSMAELGDLAEKAGLSYQLVYRRPGQPVPFPALVHWRLGHYSAVIGKQNGRYEIRDPIFPGATSWVTAAALDAESSGYFLLPTRPGQTLPWRTVAPAEAANIWGKGPTTGVQKGNAGDPGAHGGNNGCPMCSYDISEATVGLTLSDAPVGYSPPIGPPVRLAIKYNQNEDSQPATFSYFNVSQKWNINWLTFVTDDPTNPGATVSLFMPTGDAYYYTGYNSANGRFTAQNTDGSILVLTSLSPITYELLRRDGSMAVYSQSSGATSYPRNVFLTKEVDPQGNALTLTYDSSQRLTTVTDAVGRNTTLTYGLSASPLLVTAVTDPFGRSATFTYDSSGRLSSITDILGLTSSFVYDANSLIDQMTTPYGVTQFSYTTPGASGPPRFLQITDPLGYHEREEWLEPAPISDSDPSSTVPTGMPLTPTNEYLTYRDSFYWDRNAYVVAGCTPTGGCDYTKARDTHFLHVADTNIKSTTIESIKNALENRIWYNYDGQSSSIYQGSYASPIATGRVLDDGTTQLTQNTYDTAGFYKLTSTTDGVGRVTSYSYANQIDLAAVAQTTASGVQTTIAQYIYNTQHQPIFATDAAGQTTHLAYNSAGQLTSLTNPLNQTTTYQYDTLANLSSITNANGATAVSYTYDTFDRVATATDSEGWTVDYSYDAADRVTKVTYPDGTSESYSYNRLDLASATDRLGRVWAYTYDANRRLTQVVDFNGNATLFAYSPTGEMTQRTDAKGNITQWAYDVENRLTTKTYADSSTSVSAYEATTSRLHTVTDALAQVKTFAYDHANMALSITYSGVVNPTPNVTFAYDPYYPRLTSMVDGGGTTQYSYVAVGLLGALKVAQDTEPLANVVYAYDALGRLASRTVSGAGAETYGYDAIGRLTSHGSDLGAFTLGYLGQTAQITSRQLTGSTLATTWSYLTNTQDRRLQGISTAGLSSGQVTGFQYASNAVNETTGTTQTSDATISYPPNTLAQTGSFNDLNQLTNLSGQALTWDADGNLLSDGTRTYAWDAENRLVSISYPGVSGKATAFTYDGLGRRISISSTPAGGGTAAVLDYVWCGESLCQARTSSGTVARGYYAEGEYVPGASSASLYYALDRTGSVRRALSATAAPSFDYDPYGNPLQSTAPVTDFAYAGTFYNTDSGLYLTRHRPYDPASGRFLTRDPMGESADIAGNLYPYAGDGPMDGSDPAGLFCLPDLLAHLGNLLQGLPPPFNNPFLLPLLTEIAGGGPEDPLADLAVALELDAMEGGAAAAAADGLAAASEAELPTALTSAPQAAAPAVPQALPPAAPDFIVTPGGDVIPVPEGATGPSDTISPGIQFNGGQGGNGLNPNVTDVRIMDGNAQNPSGYVNYGSRQANGGWQSVNPYTGQSIPPSNPWWHIPINLGP